jgi:hypothetical protein
MAKGVRALKIFLKDPSKPLPIKKAVQAFCALCTGKYADGPEDCRQGIGSGSPCPLYNFHPYNPKKTKSNRASRPANPAAIEALKLARQKRNENRKLDATHERKVYSL